MNQEKYYERPPGVGSREGSLKETFDNSSGSFYEYPLEVWDEKTCKKWSKHNPADYWGARGPKGQINHHSSHYAEYGQIRYFNGGCVREGKWYQGEARPLPIINEKYEFYHLHSWGLIIRLKQLTRK